MDNITQRISPRRGQLLARLAADRSCLLLQLEGLDENILSEDRVTTGWTAAGILAHLAYWDAFFADRFGKLARGRRDQIKPLNVEDSLDARNAAMQARFAGLSFSAGVALCQKERRSFLLALNQLSDDALFRRVQLRPGWRTTPHRWARIAHQHDAEHLVDLTRWRKTFPANDPSIRIIHRSLLRPILGLSRQEFLALAALAAQDEREKRSLIGSWTLKQVIGHLVDYERLAVVALKALAARQDPAYEVSITSFDAFNNEHGPKWASIPWEEVWAEFLATRRALLLLADSLSDEDLARPFAAPWSGMTTACGFLLDMAQHEQEHADALRQVFGLPALPRRMGRAG